MNYTWLYDYDFTPEGVNIKVIGLTVCHIAASSIRSIQIIESRKVIFTVRDMFNIFAIRLGNRWTGKFLDIGLGLFHIYMTPEDPEAAMEILKPQINLPH
ncbi:MAG: hypothetical protein ABIY70_10630 [Capsulimonas sp.]|uniref:hypothetical protein n=1 Tax=Capsulimonas sp. TaxID=2494211 RepID=UPI003263F1FD